MTTIAYKDGVIAYDSQVTRGEIITYDDYDKRIDQKGVTFVFTGAVSDFDALVAAYFGAKPEGVIDATAMVVNNGKVWIFAVDNETGPWHFPLSMDQPYAIGSGLAYALAAMDMGADPERAVQAAAKRDTATGGRIRTLKVDGYEQTDAAGRSAGVAMVGASPGT